MHLTRALKYVKQADRHTRERPTIQPVFPQSCSQHSRNKWTQGSRGREGTCQPVDPTLKNVAPRKCECPFLSTVSYTQVVKPTQQAEMMLHMQSAFLHVDINKETKNY